MTTSPSNNKTAFSNSPAHPPDDALPIALLHPFRYKKMRHTTPAVCRTPRYVRTMHSAQVVVPEKIAVFQPEGAAPVVVRVVTVIPVGAGVRAVGALPDLKVQAHVLRGP